MAEFELDRCIAQLNSVLFENQIYNLIFMKCAHKRKKLTKKDEIKSKKKKHINILFRKVGHIRKSSAAKSFETPLPTL